MPKNKKPKINKKINIEPEKDKDKTCKLGWPVPAPIMSWASSKNTEHFTKLNT